MSLLMSDPRLANCRRIFLRDWTVDANIGVYSAERTGTQQLVLNLDIFASLESTTPRRDDLSEVIDYDFIRLTVQRRIARGHINLQETLVDDIVEALLQHPGVLAARVSSEKIEIYASVAGIGIEVFRFKAGL
jgi:dihydroneopterin aldolase